MGYTVQVLPTQYLKALILIANSCLIEPHLCPLLSVCGHLCDSSFGQLFCWLIFSVSVYPAHEDPHCSTSLLIISLLERLNSFYQGVEITRQPLLHV